MEKTKVMISGRDLHTLQTSGKYPCVVCMKGVGKNSVFCSGCSFWVHRKCSDILGRLVEDPDFRCRSCLGNHGQLMEDLVLKSNFLMENLM